MGPCRGTRQQRGKPPATFHGVGFWPSPVLLGCWPLQLQGLMLFGAQPPTPAASAWVVGVTAWAVTILVMGTVLGEP